MNNDKMTHKAQDCLSCISLEIVDKTADGYTEPRTVQDFNFGQVKTIQDLINCQLTPFQLDYLITLLSFDGEYSWKLEIIEKLKKQKEMWENTGKEDSYD